MSESSFIKVAFFDLGGTLIGSSRDWLPGAQEVLAKLSEKHIRLGIISNTANLQRPAILELLPTNFNLGIFETPLVIFSSETAFAKPDPRIFRLAIQRSGVVAAKCLFCTEEPSHITVAQQEGMPTVTVRRPPNSDIGKLITKLVSRGLLPA